MDASPRLLHRVVAALALPLLLVPALADAAPARRRAPVRAARPSVAKPATADISIIPLPLNPIVPAGQRLCSARTPTGLGYTMLRAGTGVKPTNTDYTLVNYIGYLATSGVVFDQGTMSPLQVSEVIDGFSQGLRMLARGGVIRLCIPATLGYGDHASGPIPANSDLVFQVELLDIRTSAEVDAIRKAQEGASPPTEGAEPKTDPNP